MSHTEYQNWIDYLKSEKITKKNIVKYIDMYEKYTIKRLREIVKHHNKMVRKEAMIMKKKEIKDNVIKVTDYKTKDALVARMKKSKKYHEQYVLGLQEKKPKQEERINQMVEETLKTYKELLIKNKEDAKQYLNYKAFDIHKISEEFGVDRIGTMTEFKVDIRKQAKNDMKGAKAAKNNVSIDKLPADQQKFLKDLSKLPKPLQSLKKINKYISKISKSKPEQKKKLIDANIKIVKKLDSKKIKDLKLPEDQKKLLIALSKLDNPLAALKKLVEKVGYKPTVKQVVKAVVKSPEKAITDSDDPYKILGISEDATNVEIKTAYRKLALKYHPDKNLKNKKLAEQNFKKIGNAYQQLSGNKENEEMNIKYYDGKNYYVSENELEVFDFETGEETGKTWAEIKSEKPKKSSVRKFTYTADGFKKYADGKEGPGSKPTAKKPAAKKGQDLSDVVDILDDISSKQLDQLYERLKSDKKFGTDYKKFNKKLNEVVDDFRKQSKDQGVKLELISMYYKDTLLNELVGIAEDYIKKFKYKDVHVMPSGKIMQDKKMDSKKEEGKSAALSKDAPSKKMNPEQDKVGNEEDANCHNLKNQSSSIITFYTKNKGVIKNSFYKNKKEVEKKVDDFKVQVNTPKYAIRCSKVLLEQLKKAIKLHDEFKTKKPTPKAQNKDAPKKTNTTDKFLQYPGSSKDVTEYLNLKKKIESVINDKAIPQSLKAYEPDYTKSIKKIAKLKLKIMKKSNPDIKGDVINYLDNLFKKNKNNPKK